MKGIYHTFIYNAIYLFTYLFVYLFINYTTLPGTLSVAYRMVSEYWMAMDEECSGCDPALSNILAFAWRDWENPQILSAKTTELGSETWIRYIPYTKTECQIFNRHNGFKSRPLARLSWLNVSVGFLSLSRQMQRCYSKQGHNRARVRDLKPIHPVYENGVPNVRSPQWVAHARVRTLHMNRWNLTLGPPPS